MNPAPVALLKELGAAVATNTGDVAAQSDVIFTMLPDSAAVDAVVTGPDGLLARCNADATG